MEDTAQATFDVDNYDGYVTIQSESAVRHLASWYAYDHGEENEQHAPQRRDEVSAALREEWNPAAKAGVHVEEARLTHLAYAPEIAGDASPPAGRGHHAARQKIVHGAVSMVEMALQRSGREARDPLDGTQGDDGQQSASSALRRERKLNPSSTPARSMPDKCAAHTTRKNGTLKGLLATRPLLL